MLTMSNINYVVVVIYIIFYKGNIYKCSNKKL